MPSVGMRRTTRVFGVVKGIDEARVLRSGRRLCLESDVSKVKKPHKTDEDMPLNVENNQTTCTDHGNCMHDTDAAPARNECGRQIVGFEQGDDPTDVEEVGEGDQTELGNTESLDDRNEKVCDKMWGLVYSRKRKRKGSEEKKFGDSFSRGERRCKRVDENTSLPVVECSHGEADFPRQDFPHRFVLPLYAGASDILSGNCRSIAFADILFSVLSYLREKRVSLLQLLKILTSNPNSGIFCSHGIQLLKDIPPNSSGICKIYGARQLIPLFSVDFSAVPLCFLYMHSSVLLRYRFAPVIYVYSPVNENVGEVVLSHTECLTECKVLVAEVDNLEKKSVIHPSVTSSKLACRTAAFRNSIYSRSIQKRRSSLRSRRGKNSPRVSIDNPNGSLLSDLINRRKNGIPFSSVAPNKLTNSTSVGYSKEVSCALVGSQQNSDSSCCSANILIMESDRCYREEAAAIMLEMSDSGEWVLSIKRDGLTRYSHKAQNVMRPSSSNRVTHDILWTSDSGWKLEFPRRRDWMIFKDLYRECFNRNVHLSLNAKTIPVPGVHEVAGYFDQNVYRFCRPCSYITVKDDEVSRSLAKQTASYDMDVEDEEWLNKFNSEYFGVDKLFEHLTPENFELMIDAYEKVYYTCPDDISDEKAAAKFCSELGQKAVIEAVYSYWKKKRKQKRSALVRVFQVQQQKRASVIPKPGLRKRRSIKRQGSQCGRGQRQNHLRGMPVERSAQVEQNALQRVKELKTSVNKSVGFAALKRKRAQFLMNNADLATYKATIALQIAEAAAQYGESLDSAGAAHLFDGQS